MNSNDILTAWFGPSIYSNTVNSTIKANETIVVRSKPHYVRYTMNNLKKRSTKRLETMYHNTFGKADVNREKMIVDLYNRLNLLWNTYEGNGTTIERKIDQFGFEYIEGVVPAKNPKGRPMVFETEQQITKLYVEYLQGKTLKQLQTEYGVNIATLSQTFNGKGKYASWLFGDESDYIQ